MEELKKAYEAINMLENLGLPVSKEQKEAVLKMERTFLKEKILPRIEQEMQQLVKDFKGEFYAYISFSRDNGVKFTLFDHDDKNTDDENDNARKVSSKLKKFIIRVVLPDGSSICHRHVYQTLIDVVELAGPENVMNLDIPSVTGNLIDLHLAEHPVYSRSQKRLSSGHYIQTNSSTDKKFEQINIINRKLNLGLKVEKVIIDPPKY